MKHITPQELGYTNDPFTDSNTLRDYIRLLNIRERAENEQKRKAAIERIKALRQRTRDQQETVAYTHTIGHIS